jgi:CRP-like cAMP-binding protein
VIVEALSEKVEFLFYEKNRTIIREGHRADCVYFIINGEILVSKKLYSKSDDQILNRPINIISAGECFGHVSLIYEKQRNETCISKSRFIQLFECV